MTIAQRRLSLETIHTHNALPQVLWALGYRSESAMDVGAIMAMERMGHELIAPLVFVLDNRIWGDADGATFAHLCKRHAPSWLHGSVCWRHAIHANTAALG